LNADWSEEIIENIKNSKKLFILIDHDNSEKLRKWTENGLKKY
jgi:5S rRNA maturation endonuclease (ribonuclease M5)